MWVSIVEIRNMDMSGVEMERSIRMVESDQCILAIGRMGREMVWEPNTRGSCHRIGESGGMIGVTESVMEWFGCGWG